MNGFDAFYDLFPRKQGVSKQAALKAWNRIDPDIFVTKKIMDRLREHIAGEWAGKEAQFIPHPATWLNQRRWEDGENAPLPQAADPTEGRPTFLTGMPKWPEPTEAERAEGKQLLHDLQKKLMDRLDMRSRLRTKAKISQMNQ